jgi:TolA-binding protein
MVEWVMMLSAATAIAATGFAVVGVLWLKKLRETVSSTLSETARQQVHTAQRLSEALGHLQKQQRNYDQQLQNLTQANIRLRQDITAMASRLEHNEREQHTPQADRILH